jgi:arylsulfatase A-like enzyme
MSEAGKQISDQWGGMVKKAVVLVALLMSVLVAQAAQRPLNVVFILADDLGYSDTTLYGATELYQTPNLERLAARGMIFNRAYANSPLCSPTRASIMTGQTPARHGSTRPEHHKGEVRLKPEMEESAKPGSKVLGIRTVNRLDTNLPTLGKMFKQGGYATGHFGKWHLGPEPYSPLDHGFDVDIPHTPSPGPVGGYLAPWRFARNLQPQAKGEHIEDRMAKEAIRWMKGLPKNKPFFMNYWQFSVHAPFDAKPELVEKYKKLVDPNSPQRSPTYAAMVESCDDAVGALLDAVDQAGIADRTVIVFISDNGGNVHDQLARDGGVPPTSNYPLSGGKATIREGGVHVPCIVVWPGVTKPGSRSDEVIQTADFYPTLLDNLGIARPKNHTLDGMNIMPALKGGTLGRDGIFTYFPVGMPAPGWLPPSMAVYSGDWKLIRIFHGGENSAHDYRLYNVVEDLGESNDLKEAHPEVVKRLDRMIEKDIKESGAVVPLPNPDFDPAQYHPENIGHSVAERRAAAKTSAILGVEGWTAGKGCALSQRDGQLAVDIAEVKSSFQPDRLKPLKGGPFTLKLRVKSTASGKSSLFYNKPSRETLLSIHIEHDGVFHEVSIEIPDEKLKSLRFNPARGTGTMTFDWIRIFDAAGKTVGGWEFDDVAKSEPAVMKIKKKVSARQPDQSQDFKINLYADETNQWKGQRNKLWNSWKSHPSHGFAFLRDSEKWMNARWQPKEIKNVRILGGVKDPTKHRWLQGIKNGEPICDFTGLIEILKAEKAQGLTPGIVLDNVPWEMGHHKAPGRPSEKTVVHWGKYGHSGPPVSFDIWKKYIKKFLNACIKAFGKDEVSRWQFRVGTEPDNNRISVDWEGYIKHYDHTVQAVTEIIPNAWIGPGNFIASWQDQHKTSYKLEAFLKHCAKGKNHATGKIGTRINYLAFSAYTKSHSPTPTTKSLPHEFAFRKARELLKKYSTLNKYRDNDTIPDWFAIEAHEYGDLSSLRMGKDFLWMTEWMAGCHAYTMDLAYNKYGVYMACFWFQSQHYDQWYPYVRVTQMLSEMEGGTLVKVEKKTKSQSDKVKYGAISVWKDGSLYVLIYNFNWDPLHSGLGPRQKRTHTIDNTITLNISGNRISASPNWTLDHRIINEKPGNGCWFYALKEDLDKHPDLKRKTKEFYPRIPEAAWEGPVRDIILSKGKYKDNGLYKKYKKLSEIGGVGTKIPIQSSGGKITFTSHPFTQSGVQLLKFTPAQTQVRKPRGKVTYQPNVVLFFVDDMGYGELGCYGSQDLRTPHIDSLAANGVRCTAGYVTAPSCGPSRAGILTGHYQTQFGYEINPDKEFRDVFGLDLTYRTIGDYVQAAGYKTGAIGKWDLGRSVEHSPINRGFDYYYGHIAGARNYWPMKRGSEHARLSRGPGKPVEETKYLTHQLTDGALEFIDQNKKDPFFLYVAYNAPHVPFQATDEDIARNSHIKTEKRRTYAGMITALDDGVGQILEKLRKLKLEEKTLILFISDNGAPCGARNTKGYVDPNNLPLREGKGTLYEGGVRVPFIVQWKGSALPRGTTYDRPVSALDVMPTSLSVARAEIPKGLPGKNLLPYLEGNKTESPNDALFWRYKGCYAVRVGDWKLIYDARTSSPGLFNLAEDISESKNLIDAEPDRAAELKTLWQEWNKNNVAPLWQSSMIKKVRQ